MKNLIYSKFLNIPFVSLMFICCICFFLEGFIYNNIGSKILCFFSSFLFGICTVIKIVRIIKSTKIIRFKISLYKTIFLVLLGLNHLQVKLKISFFKLS